jgi:hypothetical protein
MPTIRSPASLRRRNRPAGVEPTTTSSGARTSGMARLSQGLTSPVQPSRHAGQGISPGRCRFPDGRLAEPERIPSRGGIRKAGGYSPSPLLSIPASVAWSATVSTDASFAITDRAGEGESSESALDSAPRGSEIHAVGLPLTSAPQYQPGMKLTREQAAALGERIGPWATTSCGCASG